MPQYFEASPQGTEQPRDLELELRGIPFKIRTAASVFSKEGLDKGTEVLLRKVPELPTVPRHNTAPLSSTSAPTPAACSVSKPVFVDVGCGWGPISLVMARLRPGAQIIAVDVNKRARELTSYNASTNDLDNIAVLDLTQAAAQIAPGSVDIIWSNPPIRIGKTALHEMWDFWRTRLHPIRGAAYLVVGKNLGADPFTKWLNQHGWKAEKIASSKGYRVLELHPRL